MGRIRNIFCRFYEKSVLQFCIEIFLGSFTFRPNENIILHSHNATLIVQYRPLIVLAWQRLFPICLRRMAKFSFIFDFRYVYSVRKELLSTHDYDDHRYSYS